MTIETMLRLPAVRTATGLSKAGIYAKIKAGVFPRPVKLGERASAWLASEISAWQAQRKAQRDGSRT